MHNIEEIKGVIHYDPLTGLFSRLVCKGVAKIGPCKPHLHTHGHLRMTILGRPYMLHRLAWFYVHGELPKGDIDHINGDKTDNRLTNLRDVPRGINNQNRSAPNKGNRLGVLGVRMSTSGRFEARIRANDRWMSLGHYDTAEQASAAYISAKTALHLGYATGIAQSLPQPAPNAAQGDDARDGAVARSDLWKHRYMDRRRVIGDWHARAVALGFDGVNDVLEYVAQHKTALAQYSELIYAVCTKHPGESRHETALRYIRQAENRDCGPAQSAISHAQAQGWKVGKSSVDLVAELRAASAGYEEWRVQHPKTGTYCMMFARHRNGCLFPEDDCRTWHEDFKRRYPDHDHSRYVVACVRVLTKEDQLMQDAANMIEELTNG